MQKNAGSSSGYILQGGDPYAKPVSLKPQQMISQHAEEFKYDTRQAIPEEFEEDQAFKAENLRVRLFKEDSTTSQDTTEQHSHITGKLAENPHRNMLRPGNSERDSFLPKLSFGIVFQDGSEAELEITDYDEDPIFEVMKFAIKFRIADLALIELLRRRVVREIMRKKGMYKATPSNHHNAGSKTGAAPAMMGSTKPQNLSFTTRRASEGIGLNAQIGLTQTSKNLKKITESIAKPLQIETSSSGLHSSQVSGSNSNLIPKVQSHSSAAKASTQNTQTSWRGPVSSSQNGLNSLLNPQFGTHLLIPPPNSKTKLKPGQANQTQDSRSFLQASMSRERDYSQSGGVPTPSPNDTPTEQRRMALQGSGSQMGRARQAPSNSIDNSKAKNELLYHTTTREIRPETVTHNLYKQQVPSGGLYRQNSDSSQGAGQGQGGGSQHSSRSQIPEVSYTLSKVAQQVKVASGTGSSTTPPAKQSATPQGPLASVHALAAPETHEWLFGLLDSDKDGLISARDMDLERLTDATSADVFEALQVVLEAVFERSLRLDRDGWMLLMRDLAATRVWD